MFADVNAVAEALFEEDDVAARLLSARLIRHADDEQQVRYDRGEGHLAKHHVAEPVASHVGEEARTKTEGFLAIGKMKPANVVGEAEADPAW